MKKSPAKKSKSNTKNMDMKKKLIYETPEAEVLVFQMKETVCAVSDFHGFEEEDDWDKEEEEG